MWRRGKGWASQVRRSWFVLAGLALAFACYYAPWYTHHTAAFTMHAYDLAEWASLHPAVRSSSPPMMTSFLLRWPHIALLVALAFAANQVGDARERWFVRVIVIMLVLRFVPPNEFFSSARDDPNYRQMALLVVLGLAAVVVSPLAGRLALRWQRFIVGAVSVSGGVAGWWGLSRTDLLMDNFQIDVSVGPGFIGFVLFTALVIILSLWPFNKEARLGASGPYREVK